MQPANRSSIQPGYLSPTPPPPAPHIQALPQELRTMIFSHFPAAQALEARSVCREWNVLLNEDGLWGHFAARDGVYLDPDNARKMESCKEHYFYEKRICSNWIKGIFARQSIPAYALGECPSAKDRELIIGTVTGHIHTIDLDTGTVTQQCNTKMDAITHVRRMGDKKLAFACTDNQIRIWNLETETCEQTLIPNGRLLSLHLTEKGQLLSGSDSNAIYMWNTETGAFETLNDGQHTQGIICLDSISEGDILSLDGAGKIKKWNSETKTCERTFCSEETGDATHLCLTKGGLLIAGNASGVVRVLDLGTGICEKSFFLGKTREIISLYATKQERLIVVDDIGEITIWDLKGKYIDILSRTSLRRMTKDWDGSFCLPGERELIIFGIQESTIVDFNASNNEVFEDIANQFEMSMGNQWELERANRRFEAMPDKDKEKIYLELDRILGTTGSGKKAFLDNPYLDYQNKAQAIRNFLLV